MNFIKKLNFMTKLNSVFALLSGLLIFVTGLLISYEVFLRYFLGSPSNWPHDVSRYMLLAISLLGAAFTFQEDGHIKVEIFTKKLSKKSNRILSVFVCLISVVFFTVILWKATEMYLKATSMNWKTVASFMIPSNILYGIIIVGVFLLIITILLKVIENLFEPLGDKKINS